MDKRPIKEPPTPKKPPVRKPPTPSKSPMREPPRRPKQGSIPIGDPPKQH